MTQRRRRNVGNEPDDDTLQRPCGVCDAQPGDPCRDVGGDDGPGDGRPMPRGVYHARRAFPGTGPIRLRHTGELNAEGGGVFEVVPVEESSGGEGSAS